MNPAVAATGSGGIAGAVVVLFNALLQHFSGGQLSPEVVAAEVTVATALAGVGAHYLTRIVPEEAPAPAPVEPKP